MLSDFEESDDDKDDVEETETRTETFKLTHLYLYIYILFVIFKNYGSLNYFFSFLTVFSEKSKTRRCSSKKVFCKYAVNLRRRPTQKSDFNKVAHVCRTPLKKTSGGLLPKIVTFLTS